MKIILSPSKTYNTKPTQLLDDVATSTPLFEEEAMTLLKPIQKIKKDDMGKMMKIKGKLLEDTYQSFQNFKEFTSQKAILHYTGFVYKKLQLNRYDATHWSYIQEHIRILSAFYGVLHPFDGIKPYRLDFTMSHKKLPKLLPYWNEKVNNYFKDEMIINLASQEFSQLIDHPMLTIDFLEEKKGDYHNLSTYAKQARGLMIDYLIKNRIEDVEKIKAFNLDGYCFHQTLSSDDHYVFTRCLE